MQAAPLPDEWSRFEHYATRVHVLTITELEQGHDSFLGASRYEVLLQYPGTRPLPALTSLEFFETNGHLHNTSVKLFIQPTLEKLRWTYTTNEGCLRVLSTIAAAALSQSKTIHSPF